MKMDKSETTVSYVLDLFKGTVTQEFETEEELRQAYAEGIKVRKPESMEMYRHHVMSFKERIEP